MKTIKATYYLIPVVLCVLVVLGLLYYYFLTDFAEEKETVGYVYIDDDDTADSVFTKLEPYASAHAMAGFKCIARHWDYKDKVRTGRYAIKPGISVVNTFRNLKNGHQEAEMLTVPESKTMERLAGALSRKLMIDSTMIVNSLTDNDFCGRWGYDTATIACLFVPNTYEVYWNVSLDGMMERMQKEHDHFWNGERTAKATAIGLTPNEVSTMASIIDEETANNDEKPMIAGMYLNRLKEGMPLQADPTVKFAMKQFELKRIYHDMLFYDSPYNTYRNIGLPPGPIKIASIKGIDAVLNRVDHNYLYMCAKEDFSGTHNFARTYSEHLKNAAKYSKALNERGIK
jgi:UPF0755 protein